MKDRKAFPWPSEHRRNLVRKRSYRFAVLNWGTRGDIQPFVALGVELTSRGHQVVLAGREQYRALVEEHGLEFSVMPEDGTEDLMRALAAVKNLPDMLQTTTTYSRRVSPQQLQSFWEASRGADAIICKAITTVPALHVAEARGLPVFLTHFDPGFLPTKDYSFWDGRIRNRGAGLNRFLAGFLLLSFGLFLTDKINTWRLAKKLPLDPLVLRNWSMHLARFPAFAAWSPHFLPRPTDWPAQVAQTGWWSLTNDGRIDKRLRDFVEAGPPPVYIGFGSWGVHEKTTVTNVLLEAVRLTGNRAVVLRNTVDDREFPPDILVADDLPHDWLLPRMKAAVHHGGAGTTGAVIRAGIPSVIVPSFPMQAAWGHLVAEKKIGRTLAKREMEVERLAAALREVDQPEIRERAGDLGVRARADGGVRQAADEIERLLWEAAPETTIHPVPVLPSVHPAAGDFATRLRPVEPLGRIKLPEKELTADQPKKRD
jgi:sterol 3beta-glucosyltransferase